jgi:Pyridoxamine 5'-phosphate oxidase
MLSGGYHVALALRLRSEEPGSPPDPTSVRSVALPALGVLRRRVELAHRVAGLVDERGLVCRCRCLAHFFMLIPRQGGIRSRRPLSGTVFSQARGRSAKPGWSRNEFAVCNDRAVLTWAELERAAPDITVHGRELLERFQFVFVGTLTKDGSPRVNPCEAYVIDGHLLLNMMPRSLKALDLLRDPRIYVHTPVTSKEAGEGGEFKLAGSAPVLEDVGLRRKLDDLFWQMIQWRPAPDSHYFEVLAERIAYHKYGGDEIALRWRATR